MSISITGQWKKISSGECAGKYPDEIQFYDHPRFLAKKGPNQDFIIWDAGGYRLTDSGQLQIQIATDQQVLYEFSLAGDVLRLIDEDGCEFKYQRVE
jgi:hypothetical protein